VLNRGWGFGLLAGETCFGGRGGGRRAPWEGSAGVGFGDGSKREVSSPSASSGAGFATDESMTTIFPAPPFLTGKWVGGDGRRPVVPLDGKGGRGPLFGVGELSAISFSAWVCPENRDGDAGRFARRQQAACRVNRIHGTAQRQTNQRHGKPSLGRSPPGGRDAKG